MRRLLLSLLLLLLPCRAHAETTLATDAAPWFLHGFSAIVSHEPTPRDRVSLEVWSMRLPTFAVELARDNVDQGFRHDVRLAGAVYYDRSFGAFHVGGFVNLMRARITRGAEQGDVTIAETIARAGYRWLPMGPRGLSIDPWLGLGPQIALGALPTLEGRRYALFPVQLLGTVHVGIRF